MTNNSINFDHQSLANANTPEPSPNIPPDPNNGEFRWDEAFIKANHFSLVKTKTKRFEILVPQTVANSVQIAVKKTVAILLAHSKISIIPHTNNTSRNAVQHERDLPIEVVAMKDYIFDVGKTYHNGIAHFKASFLVETREGLSKIKKNGALSPLRDRRIYVQEFDSTEVFDSREVGFFCNLHPTLLAKHKVIQELKNYVKEITGKDISLKLKLTNRYFGNAKEGSVKTQYLALFIESEYSKTVGPIIGRGLEEGKILQRWKNVKLLPTRPTLHESFNREKFFQVLQVHNKTLREMTRVAIKNMWVGDYNLWENEALYHALDIPNGRYTFRQLLLGAADSQRINISDFYVAGSQAFIVCKNSDYTKICEFVDIFLAICKEKYGDENFAKQMRSVDPYDPKRHPTRVSRPIYTSTKGVDEMIKNVGNGVKLLKIPTNTTKTFTSHRNERLWSHVLVSPSRQDSNTSPLTTDSDNKLRNLHEEVSQLKEAMDNRTKKNKEKIEMLTETVRELKDSLKMSMNQQEHMNNTIMEAMQPMQEQMSKITATQTKIQSMFLKMSGVYSPMKITQNEFPRTQPTSYDLTLEDTTDDDSMDFNMTNLKRSRDERIIDQTDLKTSIKERSNKKQGPQDTPERSNLSKRTQRNSDSDPLLNVSEGHAQP